jgi:PAS domain S-box-containing protein
VQAFRDLIGQLLHESDRQLAHWKTKILEAVGENGQVAIEVIPELELIIGHQPAALELSASAAQNRFNNLFQKFIQVFTTSQPLTIFLDDLQWADSASLSLLQLLMQDVGHLLILGAYRDNEVSLVHPFMLTVNSLKQAGVKIETIALQPLSQADINQLVADTLSCDLAYAKPLTDLVYLKTQGNPFFTTQFLKTLHQEGFIQFHVVDESSQGGWQCDLSQIKLQSLTDDVVAFMAQQLQKLPQNTQSMLKLAACIGSQFDLQTLAIVSERSPIETAAALWRALAEGLIVPLNQIYKFFQMDSEVVRENPSGFQIDDSSSCSYRFLHDRVQQAAYSLIPDSQKEVVHLNIGRLLLARTPRSDRELPQFQIVNQLNRGISLIEDSGEREQLAYLNWRAGEKARSATAYEAAMNYLDTGLQLLSAQSWQNQYVLSLGLHQLAVEVAYLANAYDHMATIMAIGLQNARNHLDRAKFYETQILALVAQNQVRAAVDYARKILSIFGVSFPKNLSKMRTILGFLATLYRMAGKSPQDLLKLPTMSDPYKLTACNLLNAMGAASASGMPEILPFMTFIGLSLYLRYGNIPKSSMAYTIYGYLLCERLGRIDQGYAIGKAAIALCHETFSRAALAPTLFLWQRFIAYRKESLRDLSPILLEAYQVSLEVGDIEYAAYSLCVYFTQAYWTGQNLMDLQRDAIASRAALQKLKQRAMTDVFALNCQSLENLITETEDVCQLVGQFFDETAIASSDRQLQAQTSFRKLHLALLFDRPELALEQIAIIEARLESIDGTFIKTLLYFYDALVRLVLYPHLGKAEQRQALAKVKTDIKLLTKLAKSAPMNYQHKLLLVEAENLRVLGKPSQAGELYDRAIAGAKENDYTQEEALANELAAKFYLDLGREKIAQVYMVEAYYGYIRWGATAKVDDLVTRYPKLLASIQQNPPVPDFLAKSSSHTTTGVLATLDLATILNASQSISSEIELDKLLGKLLNIAIVNAGAEKCVLLLQVEEELQIAALGTSGQQPQILSTPISLELSQDVARSLVNWVKRSLEPLVLADARENTQFASDRYIIQHQPKSILCTPILKQGKLLGVLYLENNLTVGAFTSDRIAVLNHLSIQAAISLDNSRFLYESQQSKLDLQQSNAFLEAQREASPDGILVIDKNRRVSAYNHGFAELWGIPQRILDTNDDYQLLGFVLDRLDQPEEFLKKVEYLYKHPQEASFDEINLKNGQFLERASTSVILPSGEHCGRIWSFRDISEKKRTEAALKASELELRSLFLGMDDVVFVVDRNGKYLKIAPTNADKLYLPPDILISKGIQEVFPLEQAEQFLSVIRNTLNNQQTQEYEYSLSIQDREFWFSARCSPLTEQTVIWVARDISDRKAAEVQLKQQAQQLEEYTQTLGQKVEERTQELSEALVNLQTTQNELILSEKMAALGQLTASIAHEINTPLGVIRAAASSIISAFQSSLQKFPELIQSLSPQQQAAFLKLVNTSLQNQQTLSTKEERKLRRQIEAFLESQGIVNSENIAMQLTLMQTGDDLPVYESILQVDNSAEILEVAYNMVLQYQFTNNIQQEVDRAAKIVFALKTYSHRSESGEKSLTQISDGIEIALTLYQSRLKQGIEVIRKYEPVPDIICDPDALTQVWVNLIDNAIYAIGKAGTLEIAIATQAEQVMVEITNSGTKIPDEIMPRLFEPFFTTKPRGEGSGLGLDIVRQIVQKHDGEIQVQSRSGRTTFTVRLPLSRSMGVADVK